MMVLSGCSWVLWKGEIESKPNELTLWCETNNVVSFIDDTREWNHRNQQDYHETRRWWWCNYYRFNAHTYTEGWTLHEAIPKFVSQWWWWRKVVWSNADVEEKVSLIPGFCGQKWKAIEKLGNFEIIVAPLDEKDLINFPEIISCEEAEEIQIFYEWYRIKKKLPEKD